MTNGKIATDSFAIKRIAPLAAAAAFFLSACTAPAAAPTAAPKPAEGPSPSPAAAAVSSPPVPSIPPPVAAVASPSPSPAAGAGASIAATFTFPSLPIAEVQNAVLPNSVQNDRRIPLGGVGSDLWRAPNDPPNEFWMITDRGPNGQIRVDNANRRTFPIPDFDPMILKVRTESGGAITVLQTIPLVGQTGKPATGLSNIEGFDEVPWDYTAQQRGTYNANGLDTEGLVRMSSGDFWLVEEYSPSFLKVDASGKIVKRFMPEGLKLGATDYPVEANLLAIYGKRKSNRGFEGLAISPDEKQLYAALQSPLSNPNAQVGDPSRNTRILVFDPVSGRPTAEYLYRFQVSTEFGPNNPPAEMKISSVVAVGPTTLLVNERTDPIAKLFLVDLAGATNLLGSRWNDPATSPSLEGLEDPDREGIKAVQKRQLVDLSQLPGVPQKIEGLAIVDRTTLAIVNDNDFDFTGFDAAGNAELGGVKSQLMLVKLSSPLP